MTFGDFGDKQPSKGGGTPTHALLSYLKLRALLKLLAQVTCLCMQHMPALLHLHLLRRSLPLRHVTKT